MARIREMLLYFVVLILLIMIIIPLDSFSENNYTSNNSSRGATRGVPEDEWAFFRGDASRTGNSTAKGLDKYHLLWNTATNVWWNSPVVQYDQIYIVHNGGVKCFNMSGGTVWSYNVGSQYGSALVYDGRVYFASGTGQLHCLDANATGPGSTTNYWTYRPSGVSFSASSPVTDGEKIYYSTQHISGLHAVWLSNGTKAWNASLGGSQVSESSPAYWNGRVYCGGGYSYGTGSTGLYCYNATNGALLWTFNAGDDICATPAVEYGRIYFGSLDGKIYCVDAIGSGGTTTKYWEYSVGSSDVFGSCSVAYGRVYIGDSGNTLRCLDALATGGSTTQYWSTTITPTTIYGVCSSPAVTSEYVFIGNAGNAIHCRNRTTGALEWSKTLTPTATYGISSSPAVYKDKLIVTSDNYNMYVLGPDIIPPKVVSSSPTNGAVDVMLDANISIKFAEDIDASSITTSNFVLKDSQNNVVSGILSTDMGIETVYFTPDSDLAKEETYNFTVKAGVTDLWGNGLDGNGNGIAEGLGIDYFGFNFTTIPFYPPSIGNIPILKPTEDIEFKLDLTAYLSDPDTPKANLILTEDSEFGTLDGFKLTLLYPEGVLKDSINLTVSDGILTDYQILTVWVKPVNDPPVLGPIEPLELTEDVSYILNVSSYITDVDSPLSNLTVYDTTYSSFVKVHGMEFNFTYPEGVTEDKINITVYDSYEDELRDSQDLEITIEPVNDAPTIKQLPPVTVKEDGTFTYSVDEYISDVDTPKTTLMISVDSPYVTVKGHELTLTYPDSVSTDILNVKVFDGEYYDNESLFVFVDPVNDPPMIISIDSPNDGDEFEYDDTIDFSAQVSDPDLKYGGDKLTFKWTSDLDGQLASTQNASGISLSSGKHKITFTVTDQAKERDTESIEITIKAKPDEPEPEPDNNDTSEKPDTPKDNDDNKKDTSTGDNNLGLIIGGVVVVIIILILLSLLMIRKKKAKEPEPPTPSVVTTVPPQEPLQPGMPMQPLQYPPGQFPMDQTMIDPTMMDPSLMYGQFPMDPSMLDPTMMQSQYSDQGQLQDMGFQQSQPLDQPQSPALTQEPAPQFPEPQSVQPQLPPGEPQTEPVAESDDWEISTDQQQPQLQEDLQQPMEIESPDGIPVDDPLQKASTFSHEGVNTTEPEQPDASRSPEPKKDSETE